MIRLGRNCGQHLGSILCWQGGNRCAGGSRNGGWAAGRKLAKYSNLASSFIFQPIAVENLGAFSLSTLEFLSDLGHKLSSFSGEERASSFLFQRLSVSLQRLNFVLLHDTFVIDDVRSGSIVTPALISIFCFFRELYTQGH